MSGVRLPLGLVLLSLALARCGCDGASTPEACTTQTDCDGDEVCAVERDGRRVCAPACGADDPCPLNTACVERDGVRACLAIEGDLDVGSPCSDDAQCASGACLGEDGERFCAQVCVDDDGCATDERCYVVDHRKACLEPLEDRVAGEACDSPRQCASARCVRFDDDSVGVCLDGCAPDEGCVGDRHCVELDSGAHVCIDSVPDGAPCTTPLVCARGRCITDTDGEALCTGPCDDAGACEDGWACVSDSEGAPVCMPLLDDRAAGEACASARECASGHCARFATETTEYGTLCADECLEGQTCADAQLVCWEVPEGADLCGPFPE